jgi:sugar diacid utilization regulator
LDGNLSDASVVDLRLQHLNWTPTHFMYMLVLTDKSPGFFDGRAKIIPQHIHDLFPQSRWAIYEQSIVFLLSMPDDSTAFMDEDSPLHEYLQVNSLTAMFSSRFSDLLSVQTHYHQALKAYDLGRRLVADRLLYYYPDYVFHHVGAIVAEHHDLKDFLHPAVLEIIRYDDAHKTNLLETLEEYLLHNDNPTLVAANLFIHRNTLFYRISKIKELFKIDLTNGNERLKIQLSLKFLQLINN